MQSMHRQFGKLLNKGPGDNAKISALLNDYEDADRVLAKLIDHTKSWRDSWVNLTNTQLGIVTEFESLYDPIEGTGRSNAKGSVSTPEVQLNRTFQLKEAYGELKTELLQEISQIDSRVIKPATDARDCIAPIRKTIKKRENRRLDYEKAQDKSSKLQRRPGKSTKEEAALAKAEDEVAKVAGEFEFADNHLRETLPPIVDAAFSMVPPVLATIVLIQNRLLGLYYTTLAQYCEQYQFPSPPPPMDDVVATWSAGFNPVKRELESISGIAHGKAVRRPMNAVEIEPTEPENRMPTVSSLNGLRRPSSSLIPGGNSNGNGPGPMPPRPHRIPSNNSLASQAAVPSSRPTFDKAYISASNLGVPTEFTTASGFGTSPGTSPSSVRQRSDYFGNNNSSRPGTTSTVASSMSQNSAATAAIGSAIAKKKPPPPPPPKRIASGKPEEFVVAQYDFQGQGPGDLSFREGDRIKIMKKTVTDQDWWQGELGGVKGSFPANYCKAA